MLDVRQAEHYLSDEVTFDLWEDAVTTRQVRYRAFFFILGGLKKS